MPFLGIYTWSQYTLPAGIPFSDITGDTQPNDPMSPGYSSSAPSWIGETFTFNGGSPTQIEITDDDPVFEDGYVETGSPQTLTQPITIGSTTYLPGDVVENEFSLIDSSGKAIFVVRVNGENVGFTYASGEEPSIGETFTATEGFDGDPSDNANGTSSSSEPYTGVICFAAGTQIATPAGARSVESMAPGELVLTADSGNQPVLWCGLSDVELGEATSNVRPVLFPKGSLGEGLPQRDLIVSQQHRMLIDDFDLDAKGATLEVFAPAKGLLPLNGVRILNGKMDITYVHLLLPCHEVVFAEGYPTESFYPGATALNMMRPGQRDALLGCCPELKADPINGYGPTARHSLSVRQAREWARNAKDALGTPMTRKHDVTRAA
ncbi:MAG: Hint domain-containing protein [Pseudomonadota bacterium]